MRNSKSCHGSARKYKNNMMKLRVGRGKSELLTDEGVHEDVTREIIIVEVHG